MADLLNILQARSSIRSYTGETIPAVKLEKVLQAGLLSPTGRNRQPWELIVVRDKQVLQRMAECRVGAAEMLKNADCAVVVVGDRDKTDTVVEDCSIAMAYMHAEADSLGLGSCWIQGRNRQAADGRTTEDFLRELLHFPENFALVAILSLGVPAGKRGPRGLDELPYEKIHKETF